MQTLITIATTKRCLSHLLQEQKIRTACALFPSLRHSSMRSTKAGHVLLYSSRRSSLAILLQLLVFLPGTMAIGQERYVEKSSGMGSFPVANETSLATICIDPNDYPGVLRAANDLKEDIEHVAGRAPWLVLDPKCRASNIIVIGTIGKSAALEELSHLGKIDFAQISGKWESFLTQVVQYPRPGVSQALVIAGSDKRGTIYGIYDLSEQIGVSPWYWWADVPVVHKSSLYAKAGRIVQGPPAVKYRGIFLNDEAPCLTGWVTEKFGNYNHRFYTNVFELLLRLKANYLWPAMWNNCFNEDDPLNPKLADEYGIVMGTSHVEPMMRADKEWNRKGYTQREWSFDTHPDELKAFWREGIERNKP